MLEKYPDVMSIQDIQQALSIGRSTAYRLISSGEIKHWKIGKSIKIPKPFLIDYITSSCYTESIVTDSLSKEVKINDSGFI